MKDNRTVSVEINDVTHFPGGYTNHPGQYRRYRNGVSLDIENYCTLSSFFIISGFFGNVIFWMLRRSCGDIEHR